MEAGVGFEPTMEAYETSNLVQTSRSRSNTEMVADGRFERPASAYETDELPAYSNRP